MDNQQKRNLIISSVVTAILCAGIGLGGGVLLGKAIFSPSQEEQKLIEEYRLLKDEWLFGNEEQYMGDLAASGLISAVAQSVSDPFTFYTKTTEEQGLSTDGKGFGFYSRSYDGGIYITDVFDSSPARVAGLKVGDVLYGVTVQNQEYFDFKVHNQTEIHEKLSSVQDTTTKFTFEGKRGNEPLSITMTRGSYSRDVISVLQTPTSSNQNTMVIKISTFLGNPTSALQGVIGTYKDQIQHLVFDVRGNGGGYLNQAAEAASLFVKKDTLIYEMVDKNGKVKESYRQQKDPLFQIPQYSFITDSSSASATEVFALALRAGADAKIYGFKTYGKGIAQEFKTFSDGSVVRYTSAYIYGPERENETMYEEGKDSDKKMCIHGKGIIPDVTYPEDFQFLNSIADFTSSLGVSEVVQDHFLKCMNYMYPSDYPVSYGKDYHFLDAIEAYGNHLAEEYGDSSYKDPYQDDGKVKKELNDKFTKECFDQYLDRYQKVYDYAMENL